MSPNSVRGRSPATSISVRTAEVTGISSTTVRSATGRASLDGDGARVEVRCVRTTATCGVGGGRRPPIGFPADRGPVHTRCELAPHRKRERPVSDVRQIATFWRVPVTATTEEAAMSNMLEDFRKFVMRGNVLDLAVAVVIGVAFNAVVNSLVNDVIMQVIAAIVGKANFDALTFTINGGIIYYGRFLTALVNFLIIAATLFVVIKAFESLQKRRQREGEDTAEDKSDEVVLLGEIRDLLRDGQA
jgi:large conductance mechanosensitive channel